MSQNCNMWVATLPFNGTIDAPDAAANSGVVVYDMERADGFGKATMFAAIWVSAMSDTHTHIYIHACSYPLHT